MSWCRARPRSRRSTPNTKSVEARGGEAAEARGRIAAIEGIARQESPRATAPGGDQATAELHDLSRPQKHETIVMNRARTTELDPAEPLAFPDGTARAFQDGASEPELAAARRSTTALTGRDS